MGALPTDHGRTSCEISQRIAACTRGNSAARRQRLRSTHAGIRRTFVLREARHPHRATRRVFVSFSAFMQGTLLCLLDGARARRRHGPGLARPPIRSLTLYLAPRHRQSSVAVGVAACRERNANEIRYVCISDLTSAHEFNIYFIVIINMKIMINLRI